MGVIFVSGNLALDYVGTLNERFSTRVEQLRQPDDVGGWLVAAGVLDEAPVVTQAAYAGAITLREALFRAIAREIDGVDPRLTRQDRGTINAAAAVPPPTLTLTGDATVVRRGDVEAGLAAVARDGIALFRRTDGSALKWCADDACTHPFLDHSRGHRRRWCNMAGCGDRAKAAAYRRRRRAPSPTDLSELSGPMTQLSSDKSA